MTLHPQTRAALDARPPGEPLTRENLAQARRDMSEAVAFEVGTGPAVPIVRDVVATAPGADGGEGVPCRLYDPRNEHGAPVVVFLHGGGWSTGGLDTHDGVCRRLADQSGCAVLSVEYRLAPEHPYPAAITDVELVVAWLRDGGSVDHGIDPSRLAVAGDSAGGHLAALTARRARDAGTPLAFQLLVYPVIDPAMNYPDLGDYGLDAHAMTFYWDAFAPPGVNRAHPDLAPLAADLAGLPPALVITAEYDVLRDEGETYGTALAAAGVPAVTTRYLGVNHGFFRKLALYDAAAVAVDSAAAALRAALDGPPPAAAH